MGTSNFFQQSRQIFKTITMIISWTIFAILVLIIGFLAYYMVSANIYAKNGEKFEPKFSLYTIVSPSMEPNIKVYDVILNGRIDDAASIKVGDVITFISTSTISNGMTVTHRVVDIKNGKEGLEFVTKGDNNTTADTDTAKEANLLGKVIIKIPQLGRLQFFLSTKGGWLLIVLFPALLIIVNDIFKIFKLNQAKKKIEDTEKLDNKEEQIKLETFRKDEIKNKLAQKEINKAKKLEEQIKNNKSSEDANELKEETTHIDEIEEKPEFIPVIDVDTKDDIQETEEILFFPAEIKEQIENQESIKSTNIFDEEEPINIFTEDNSTKKLFEQKEPIKKENNLPIGIELPRLKKEK